VVLRLCLNSSFAGRISHKGAKIAKKRKVKH